MAEVVKTSNGRTVDAVLECGSLEPLASSGVRPVRLEDREAWIDMRLALWPEEERADLARDVDNFLAGNNPFLEAVFIANDRELPIGFLELGLRAYTEGCESSPVPHVEGWYVTVAARRKGIGRALMAAAEQWAVAHAFDELTSDGLLENEMGARAHRAAGFQEVERLIAFRKDLRTLRADS